MGLPLWLFLWISTCIKKAARPLRQAALRQFVSYSVPAPPVGGSVCPADGVAPAEGVVVSGGVAGTSASTSAAI